MSITPRLSFFRNNALALLALSLIGGLVGCSGGGTAGDPNIQLTDSYKVEYVPGEMDAAQGKTEFQIILTDLTAAKDLQARFAGPTVTLMPLMYMTDKTHSTPVANNGACVENFTTTIGTYDCTIFYVMADTMDGISTGHWELEVTIGGTESVMFYPSVGMAMGDTPVVMLRNENLAMNSVARTFHVFKSSLTGTTGDHTFELFTSTMETMMSFPVVYPNIVLNQDSLMPLPIFTMTIKVSTDPTFVTDVVDAISGANGHWSVPGIQNLVDGQEGKLYVEVIINDFVLNSSIDGVAGAGINNYGTFTITPSAPMAM